MNEKYTPTPWVAEGPLVSKKGSLLLIADCEDYAEDAENGVPDANAELIVRAVNAYASDQQIIEALTRSLKETRDAAAACFRVIAAANLADALEAELALSKIENGFGKRASAAIEEASKP